MDETPMSHAPGAAEFAGVVPPEEQSSGRTARRAALPWRSYTRCLLLAAAVGAAGWLAFRPGLLRLSILMSLVSPSRGESLAWRPEEEEEPQPAPVKFTQPPEEWRLISAHASGRIEDRPSAPENGWRSGALGAGGWKRASFNPWNWSDDVARRARRIEEPDSAPAQKPASSFRAGGAVDWANAPENETAAPAETAASTETTAERDASPAGSAFAGASATRVPSIAPLAPLPAIAYPAPGMTLPETAALETTPPAGNLPEATNEAAPPTLSLPTLSLPSQPPALQLPSLPPAQPAEPASTQSQPLPQQPLPAQPSPQQAAGTISPAEALSAAFAVAPATQPETPASVPPVPAPVDWMDSEITGPIPGAYLTIYPKLKFVGLCVPGQGYIRKYNQIAVPMDATEPKRYAADGRTPYGKYYVAGHVRDASGPRVLLSWPSVDDARRAGAGPEMLALVEDAWSRQAMPPQDSFAGGGLSLAADRASGDYTSGGFGLEAPHMEEIFTALQDGAWVFVQQ